MTGQAQHTASTVGRGHGSPVARYRRAWVLFRLVRQAAELLEAVGLEHSAVAELLRTMGAGWAAFERVVAASNPEAYGREIASLEETVRSVETTFFALDAAVPMALFRKSFDASKPPAPKLVESYIRLLASRRFRTSEARDRFEFLITRLLTTRDENGRVELGLRQWAERVLSLVIRPPYVADETIRDTAVQFFEQAAEEIERFKTIEALTGSELYLELRGYKLWLRVHTLDVDILWAIVSLNVTISNHIRALSLVAKPAPKAAGEVARAVFRPPKDDIVAPEVPPSRRDEATEQFAHARKQAVVEPRRARLSRPSMVDEVTAVQRKVSALLQVAKILELVGAERLPMVHAFGPYLDHLVKHGDPDLEGKLDKANEAVRYAEDRLLKQDAELSMVQFRLELDAKSHEPQSIEQYVSLLARHRLWTGHRRDRFDFLITRLLWLDRAVPMVLPYQNVRIMLQRLCAQTSVDTATWTAAVALFKKTQDKVQRFTDLDDALDSTFYTDVRRQKMQLGVQLLAPEILYASAELNMTITSRLHGLCQRQRRSSQELEVHFSLVRKTLDAELKTKDKLRPSDIPEDSMAPEDLELILLTIASYDPAKGPRPPS